MKALVLIAIFGAALGAPDSSSKALIEIIRQEFSSNGNGSYSYLYETSNGIAAKEEGQLKANGTEEPVLQVQGEFHYTNDNGERIDTTYLANENGFQPQGSHIPTPHPIPKAIQLALDFLATASPQPEEQGGYTETT